MLFEFPTHFEQKSSFTNRKQKVLQFWSICRLRVTCSSRSLRI